MRSQREISRTTWVSQGVISKFLRYARETTSPTQRLHGHRLKATTWDEDRVLLRIMRGNKLFSASRIRGVTQVNRMTCLCLQVQGRWVFYGYRPRHRNKCTRLTPDHLRHRRMFSYSYIMWGAWPSASMALTCFSIEIMAGSVMVNSLPYSDAKWFHRCLFISTDISIEKLRPECGIPIAHYITGGRYVPE